MQEAPIPKRTSQEYIEKFIDGRDPQERIVNLLYTYKDDFVSVVYRNKDDVKMIKKEPFKPFCWATLEACHKLFNGDRDETFKQMAKYKIGAKRLSQKNVNGEIRHEFDDGYLVMFYAQERMSYSRFLGFFKKAGNPIYSDDNDPNSRQRSRQYLCVTPQEQFLISTGKRFFKGYDDYDEVLKMTFDLETENLDTENGRITKIGVRMNRPFPGWPEGFKKIINVVGNTDEEKDESELWAIEQMLKMIYTFKPDIIAAHNGESFDWNYIIGACNRLGHPLEEISAKYFGGEGIRKDTRETVLKLGGEIETFHQTIVPRIITVDSLHAVRRAQAIDSNMKKADLKYVTEYSDLKLPNRVYVPGKLIAKTDAIKEEIFAFNDENGDWYRYDPNKKGEDPNMTWEVGQKKYIPVHGFIKEGYTLKSGKYIVDRYLQDDLYECDKVEHRYNTPNFLICKMLPVPYKKCTTMGTAGQWKSMMLAWSYENGLAIPMFGESKTFTGGLSRLLRTGFVKKVIKLDYNSLYPSIILTWGITDPTDLMLAMLHLLEHVLTQREKYKKLKKVAGNKKKSATNEDDKRKFAAEESFNDKKQLPLKIFGNSFFGSYGAPNVFPWGSLRCAEQTTCTGRMALRLMISHFHKLGYEPIVGDTDGFNFRLPDDSMYRYTDANPYLSPGLSRETENGKTYTGFKADVAEFNDVYMCDKHYSPLAVNKMGLGIDEVVESTINFSRKNYADYFPENPYPNDVKMVGNTIKSKKMPEYIEKFLAKGIRLLLQGKGQEFLDEYYNYVEKIYNYQIPLKDIASKGKIKKSIREYLDDVKQVTKAGRPKSRQAWYELAIQNNVRVQNGDTIYYVNTGNLKSHSDVKKITRFMMYDKETGASYDATKEIESASKKYKKENSYDWDMSNMTLNKFQKKFFPQATVETEIVLNCRMLPFEMIENDEEVLCSDMEGDFEYNVAKYVAQFNSRITPLLVCFSKSIRDQIIISDPKDRPYFTADQCELVSGEPNRPGDQDTYEQLMTMDDREIKFWHKYDLVPPFLEECGMGKWEDIVDDYLRRMKEEEENGVNMEKEAFYKAIQEMTQEDVNAFFEEGKVPSAILKIADIDVESNNFVSKKHEGVVVGTINDIVERSEYETVEFE